MTLNLEDKDHGTKSPIKILSNIFISFLGAGILGLPYAFKEIGVFGGTIIMVFVGIISTKAMLLIIECKYTLISQGVYTRLEDIPASLNNGGNVSKTPVNKKKNSDHVCYGDIGYEACGSIGKALVDITVVISQIGFCCAYLIFISQNLQHYVPGSYLIQWLGILLPPLFCLTLLRHLKHLGYFSLFAQGAFLFAFTLVLFSDFEKMTRSKIHVDKFNLAGLPFFSAASIYCYEGAGMILSLECSLEISKRPQFKKYFLTVMVLVTILYVTFGISGYLAFGQDTNPIITFNLPEGSKLDYAMVVKSCIGIALFFTYPVMVFPVTKIIENKTDWSNVTWKGNVLRLMLVIISGIVVLIVPNFANLMGFVGAGCCTLLAFILPGLFHWVIHRKTISKFQIAVNFMLIIIGLVGLSAGLFDAVQRLHADMHNLSESAKTGKKIVGNFVPVNRTALSLNSTNKI